MNKIYFILSFLAFVNIVQAQTSHSLLATDHYYDPDTLYIMPGDTVDVIINGYHSVTEIDSIDWVNNTDNPNGGFDVGFGSSDPNTWFVVNTPGTYYYICEPHAMMGMKGILIVQNPNAVIEQAYFKPENFNAYKLNENSINLMYKDSNQLNVFDINGKQVFQSELDINSEEFTIPNQFKTGTYIFRFSKDNNLRVAKKVVL